MRRHLPLRRIAAVTALALSFQVAAPLTAWADNEAIPGGTSPALPVDPKNPDGSPLPEQPTPLNPSNEDKSVQESSDPVEISRGEYTLSRQDVFWPGRGLPVDITFTYRSRSAYNSPFGYGWDMSDHRHIRKLSNNNLVVMRGNNRTDEFTFSAPNTYTAPPGVYDTLVQNGDGTYTLTSKHGDKEFYNVNGVLTRIEDRNGNALAFSYDAGGLLPITGKSAYFVNQTTGVIARDYRLTRITDTVGRTVNFTYNAEGRLATINYAGRTITYGYDPGGTGDLVSVTTPPTSEFPAGNTTQYTYVNHNLTTITDPKLQPYLTNAYDAATDRVTQQTYGTGTSTFTYLQVPMCPSTPGSGDPGFNLSLSPLVSNPGDSLSVTWQAPAERASHTSDWIALYRQGDPNTSYGSWFYLNGQTSGSGTLFAGATDGFYYEARYLLDAGYTDTARSNTVCVGFGSTVPIPATEVVDRNGVRTRYEFDAAGHIIRMETFTDGNPAGEPVSYVTEYEYNAAGERTRILYPKGNATEFTYDAKGNLLEIRRKKIGMTPGVADATDLVTAFSYEPNFNFIDTITDPNLKVTSYTYDYELAEPMKGNLRNITFPTVSAGTPEAFFTYTGFGQLDTATDPENVVTKYTYESATGYLSQVTEGFGTAEAGMTNFTYDAVGNITSIQDPRLNTTTFLYNDLNQLTEVTAPAPFSFKTRYHYDANGNLIHADRQLTETAPGVQPPLGTVNPTDDWQSTVYAYTILDQLASVKDDLGNLTQFGYDASGNRTSIIDAKNQTTGYLYDERNLTWRVTDAQTPVPGITEYLYDLNGNLASLIDANGNTTTYAYDDFDRLTRTTYADTRFEAFTYDAASNLISRVNARGQALTYTYDALNRLTQKTTPSETATYAYDAASRLLTAANPAGTLTHSYDGRGRLSQVVFPGSQTVVSTYDAASNRASLAYPGGPTATYAYDQLNRLSSLTDLNAQTVLFAYDALSRRKTLTHPNGVNSAYTYDSANRLTQLSTRNSQLTTLSSFAYTYDPLGNRQTLTDTVGLHSYTYDPLSQLTSADEPPGGTPDLTFQYDRVGNRLQVTRGGIPESYSPNQLSQYISIDSTPQLHDPDGNLTNDGTATYAYDAENRLTQVVKGATTVQFTYDAFGRRASKSVNGVVTKFFYDGEDLIVETDAAGNLIARSLFGPGIDEPLERKAGSTTHYYAADGLGSIVHLTTSTGAIAESYTYEVFGTPTIRNGSGTVIPTSAVGNRFLFTGREWDSEVNLYYYRRRYYDPRIGRFTSRDPLSYLPDVNLYRYVGNSPVNWVDPFGLDKQRRGQQNQTTTILLPGIYPGGPRFVHQEASGRRYWSSSARPTPAPGPSPLASGVTAVGSYYNDPGRILRHGGRITTEVGYPGPGRLMGFGGLVLEPGGPGKIVGIAAGGTIGAAAGRYFGGTIGSVGGPIGGIGGAMIGGTFFGWVGSWFDSPNEGAAE